MDGVNTSKEIRHGILRHAHTRPKDCADPPSGTVRWATASVTADREHEGACWQLPRGAGDASDSSFALGDAPMRKGSDLKTCRVDPTIRDVVLVSAQRTNPHPIADGPHPEMATRVTGDTVLRPRAGKRSPLQRAIIHSGSRAGVDCVSATNTTTSRGHFVHVVSK